VENLKEKKMIIMKMQCFVVRETSVFNIVLTFLVTRYIGEGMKAPDVQTVIKKFVQAVRKKKEGLTTKTNITVLIVKVNIYFL